VVDGTAPSIVCPGPQTLSTNAGCTYAGPIGTATASDNCSAAGAIDIGNDAPASLPLGMTVVTWTARDEAGNVATCQQQVTVIDETAPVLACPEDRGYTCTSAEGAIIELEASAADACDPSPAIAFEPASGSLFPVGTTTVTCTATDAAGNAATCTFTVTVSCASGGKQLPGDCNQDGSLDISDAICLLGYLFLGEPVQLACGDGTHQDAGNVALLDWQPDGGLDLADAIGMLGYLFYGSKPHPLDAGPDVCVSIDGCPDNLDCP
jgi:hypothetical protein